MIFRQLFEPISSTYTYLLGCEDTRQAILIDTVLPSWQRDLSEINALGLKLAYTFDTHIHADHITSARKLREEAHSRIAHPARDNLSCVDVPIEQASEFGIMQIDERDRVLRFDEKPRSGAANGAVKAPRVCPFV